MGDAVFHEPLLHRVGKELRAAVGLYALDWEHHLFDHGVKEIQRVPGRTAEIDAQDPPSRAVIDRGVLINAGGDLAPVHLYTVARDRSNVALAAFPAR